MEKTRISVIGCGRWGTFIACHLYKLGLDVRLYGRCGSPHFEQLVRTRANEYLSLPEGLRLTCDFWEVCECDIIVVSVGSQQLDGLTRQLSAEGIKDKTVVLCMKGIEISTGRRLTQVTGDALDPSNKTAIWVGPGHVEDFCAGIPNCMVIDSADEETKKRLVGLFSSELIRFYYGSDLIGNELGAAAKNVYGIAAGLLDGYGLSTLKGALMSRGTRETARLIVAMGGSELSAYGLCHLGDYQATLFSPHSHNRAFGECIADGKPYDKLAEGYYTCKALVGLEEKYGVDLPICNAVYEILYNSADPKAELNELFFRSVKEEFYR